MTENRIELVRCCREAVGAKRVLTDLQRTAFYRSGWRSGEGEALAVVIPGNLSELWAVLSICVESGAGIIMQAANTGLTEGSSPNGYDYDRDIVIISTQRLCNYYLSADGSQVLSLPGTSLHQLEKALEPLGRTPHSVIGSSCLGASVIGGVANNSGGALVKRGPAYTERSLYARVNSRGELELVNNLKVEGLGETPLELLQNLDDGSFVGSLRSKAESATDEAYYERVVRDTAAETPARFNADPQRLCGASGCAGKVAVFAVVTNTFKAPQTVQTFFIGTNQHAQLSNLRRHVLERFENLPEVAEYIHQDCMRAAQQYGKDTVWILRLFGTRAMPSLFRMKSRIDSLCSRSTFLPRHVSDKLLHLIGKWLPRALPKRIAEMCEKYQHLLILRAADEGIEEIREYLSTTAVANDGPRDPGIAFIECSSVEGERLMAYRFAAAGSALRCAIVNADDVEDVLPLDVALKRNEAEWVEKLPDTIQQKLFRKFYYGHFFCHVFHQDYLVHKGEDVAQVKNEILSLLESKGAKYPAEHNVGNMYDAGPVLESFYKSLDPTNTFNPGVGKMSKNKNYV